MAYESLPKPWQKLQCACADGIYCDQSLTSSNGCQSPTKTKNVPFYSLSRVLSDSLINFTPVLYENLTFCHYRDIDKQKTVKLLSVVIIPFGPTK